MYKPECKGGRDEEEIHSRPNHPNPCRSRTSGFISPKSGKKVQHFPHTIYCWRNKYEGMPASEAKRLKALEEENARLKRLLAEKELEIQALTEIIKKNF